LSAAELLITLVGVLLVLFGARDIFETLFHPEGRSTLGRLTARAIWRLSRHSLGRRRDWFTVTGPLSLVAVIGSWATMLVVGWALIYPTCRRPFTSAVGWRAAAWSTRSTSRS
jgi:hypothetical protein